MRIGVKIKKKLIKNSNIKPGFHFSISSYSYLKVSKTSVFAALIAG